MIRIVLAEDHHVVRQGLKALLAVEADLEVVGEAADGIEALRLVEKAAPDVLVVDVMLPGMHGLEIARRVRQEHPHTRVVVLSMHAEEQYVLEALRAGASGYVLKESDSAELIEAVRRAAAGKRFLSARLSDRAIEAYAEAGRDEAMADSYDTLTDREREVLQLAAEGKSNPEIAKLLFISPRTVEIHRANMMRKLDLNGQTELVRYAIRRGVIPP